MLTYNWIASGRVQGVGFRYYTYTIANKYELNGWVRNLPDGSVEMMLQGSEDRVENLRKYLMRGNMFIKVRELSERIVEEHEYTSFEIKY